MAETKINQFLGETAGKSMRADVYTSDAVEQGYTIRYHIDDVFVKEETIVGHNMTYIADACNNWMAGIKVLNG